jgi:hypothetical protein
MRFYLVAAACLAFGGCALLDQAVGVDGKPGPVENILRGVEGVATGTPIGAIASVLLGGVALYQKARAKKYAQGMEAVVTGVDRAFSHGVSLSADKQATYNLIRGAIIEIADDVAFVERTIAEHKANERSS